MGTRITKTVQVSSLEGVKCPYCDTNNCHRCDEKSSELLYQCTGGKCPPFFVVISNPASQVELELPQTVSLESLAIAYGMSEKRLKQTIAEGHILGTQICGGYRQGVIVIDGNVSKPIAIYHSSSGDVDHARIQGPGRAEPCEIYLPKLSGQATTGISTQMLPDSPVSGEVILTSFQVRKPPQHSRAEVLVKTSGVVYCIDCYPDDFCQSADAVKVTAIQTRIVADPRDCTSYVIP